MSNLTVIIGAMDEEIKSLKSQLKNIQEESWHELVFYRGQLWDKEVVVVKCGVGKVFAAMITQHLLDYYQPQQVIFTGVAGALNPKYRIGDVVVAKTTLQHDLDVTALGYERGQIPGSSYKEFVCDPKLVKQALSATLDKGSIHLGRILSGDQFITGKHRSQISYLTQELKGDAVEMEGAAVAQVCTVNQVPFVIIRTISDQADGEAPADYKKFLPMVAKNSLTVIQKILTHTVC